MPSPYQHHRQCLVWHLLLMSKKSCKSHAFPLQVQHYTNCTWTNGTVHCIFTVYLCMCKQIDIHVRINNMNVISICYEVHFLSLPSHAPKSEVSRVASGPSGSSSHILQWCGVWRFVLVVLDATARSCHDLRMFLPGRQFILHPIGPAPHRCSAISGYRACTNQK